LFRELFQTIQISGSINVLLFRQAPLGGEVSCLRGAREAFPFVFSFVLLQTTFGAGLALENVQGEFQFHNVSGVRRVIDWF
jgi:hypothetical protein